MLNGLYCRTLAEDLDGNYDTDSDSQDVEESPRELSNTAIDYESKYRSLKRKFKYLIYENECFQNALLCNHRRLLKASRDRAFLLDRLFQYEKPGSTSSDSEETVEYSEDDPTKQFKRRKLEQNGDSDADRAPKGRKKQFAAACDHKKVNTEAGSQISTADATDETQQTQADEERQLLNRAQIDFFPKSAPAMVAAEMFINEHTLYSLPNAHLVEVSSPIHVAAEECVPMEYRN